MKNTTHSIPSFSDPINTLAQSGTTIFDDFDAKPMITVYGEGTDATNIKALKGRSKRKYMIQYLARCLAQIAIEKGDDERAQQYWNTWHCQSKIIQADGRIYGNYCKNRFCLVCLANRKADTINRYYPTLKTWEDPYFVTLTITAVKAHQLNKWMQDGMIRGFRLIKDRYRKRHQRGKAPKLIGIRSLECNYNPIRKTYNPHFHIIVPNKEIASILVVEWQKQWNQGGKKLARPFAQYMRRVTDLEHDLVEIIKYGSKIFTEPDMKKRAKDKISPMIYAAALDNIFVAMKGLRIFERFGFDLPKDAGKHFSKEQEFINFEMLQYDSTCNDWVNLNTGDLLTGYMPPSQLQFLMQHSIETSAT